MMEKKTWSDVLGNNITAAETLAMAGDTDLPAWIEAQAIELWGAEECNGLDYGSIADDLRRDAGAGAKAVSKDTIEALNDAAQTHLTLKAARTTLDALMLAVPGNWQLVRTSAECSVYRTTAGNYVNLWKEGVSSQEIEEGGVGFDDQIGWAFE